MSTTTIAGRLAEIRSRIDRLRSREQDGTVDRARLRRQVQILGQELDAVVSALRDAPDDVEAKLALLSTRLDVAEHSLAADASPDWAGFAASVEAELRSWDLYLERLQTRVAEREWRARARAETTIGEIRSRRLEVDEHLRDPPAGSEGERARRRVTAARDELEQEADALSARLI